MILDRIHKIEQNADSDPAVAGLFIVTKSVIARRNDQHARRLHTGGEAVCSQIRNMRATPGCDDSRTR
jgi:hypothetical protein